MRKLVLMVSAMALPLAACGEEAATPTEPTEPVIEEPIVEEPLVEDPAMTSDADPAMTADDPVVEPMEPATDEAVAE